MVVAFSPFHGSDRTDRNKLELTNGQQTSTSNTNLRSTSLSDMSDSGKPDEVPAAEREPENEMTASEEVR